MLKAPKRSKPLISIIIPSLNKGEFVGKTLDSILGQTYSKYEVIVQDGGSTDGTLNLLKKYTQRDKRISFESKKDKGQWDAINRGMRKAKGELLTYINADDLYEKNALASVVEAYQRNLSATWFAGKGRVIGGDGREIAKAVTFYKNILLKLNSYNLLLIVNYLMQPSVFFTRRVYKKHGPFVGVGKYVMEYDLWLKVGKEQMPTVVSSYLSSFRLAKTSASSSEFKRILKEDEQIVIRHTSNKLFLFLHRLQNKGRILINRRI